MAEVIVGLVAVILIIYLFTVVLRPEWNFDRMFRKDSGVSAHWLHGSRHKIDGKRGLTERECK